MKTTFVIALTLFCMRVAQGVGLLHNGCFDVSKKGELIRTESSVICRDYDAVYDKKTASGYSDGAISGNYQIAIVDGDGGFNNIYEIDGIREFSTISADFSSLRLIVLNKGNIEDYTLCERKISKTEPLVKRDLHKCITLNKEVCNKLSHKILIDNIMKKELIGMGYEVEINAKEINKCTSVLSRANEIFSEAFTSTSDAYKKTSGYRYGQLKEFSEKKLSPKMKEATSNTFNLTPTDFNSGLNEIANTSFGGLFKMRRLFDDCARYFPEENSLKKPASAKVTSEKTKEGAK
jgi:hypothetical protein